ncbi:MAG: accessory gene regulator B family protein [Bacilli bacterium]
MREKVIEKYVSFLLKYHTYSRKEILTIRYGVENTLLFLEKIIIILVIGYLLGILKIMCIFMLFYMGIKTFSGGMHASSSFSCLLISLVIFIASPIIGVHVYFTLLEKFLISLFVFAIFLIYSPADTHKKPIRGPKIKMLKIKSLIIIDLYCISSFFVTNYIGNLLIISLLVQACMISPIPYKLFGLPYNNGRREKDENFS